MSWQATSATKRLCQNLTRSEKFLLLVLADYHNEETGQCDPSVGRLAHDALMSRAQAFRCLDALEKKGFLQIESRRENGRQTSNQYWLVCIEQGIILRPCECHLGRKELGRIQGRILSRIGETQRTSIEP